MIIDASVGFKWVVEEPESDWAFSWIGQADLRAPILFHSEIGNALRKRIRRGELAAESGAAEILRDLDDLVTSVDERPVVPRALEIALALGHSFYDCVYLALAEANDDRLLTADERFCAKVAATAFAPRVLRLASFH